MPYAYSLVQLNKKRIKMEEVKRKTKVFAKRVIDLGDYMIPREVDRTTKKHRWKFDVDVRSNKSSTPKEKRFWIYLGSHKTIEKCLEFINKNNFSDYTDVRIVDSYTGEVLKQFKF